MMQGKRKNMIRRIVDVCMTVLLLAILLGVILTMTDGKEMKDPMAGWGTSLSGDVST